MAAVRLEYDAEQDVLYADGVYGGALFERFFHEFGMRLSLEFETTHIRQLVEGTALVQPLDEYCANRILC